MKLARLLVGTPLAALGLGLAACGSDIKTVEQPVVMAPDGTVIPVTADEDGELTDGETNVEVDGPDGEKEITVEVDDD